MTEYEDHRWKLTPFPTIYRLAKQGSILLGRLEEDGSIRPITVRREHGESSQSLFGRLYDLFDEGFNLMLHRHRKINYSDRLEYRPDLRMEYYRRRSKKKSGRKRSRRR